MSLEQSMANLLKKNREARESHASRLSKVVEAITKGVPYDYDPYPEFGADTKPEGGGLPEQKGEVGVVGGNDSGEGAGVRPEAAGAESDG